MQANQSSAINRQRTARALTLCFALAGLFILMSYALRGRGSQDVSKVKLSVEDPRPVAEAILKLEAKYGWVITYEDPRYVHDSEIADVTLKVRKDLDKYKPGEAPKALVPKGGALEFTYDVVPGTNLPAYPAMVVQQLLDAQAARDNGGRFRLEAGVKVMHVIPTMIKNSEGVLVSQESALDAVISLPAEERTVYQKLEGVCTAIGRATGVPVELGTTPYNWFSREMDQQGATRQKARDVLINTFEAMDGGTNLSWRLLYGPGRKRYVLNIHYVQKHGG